MYDYISLQGNSDHSVSISTERFQQILHENSRITQRTKSSGNLKLGEFKILIQGIFCDNSGNYSFNKDSEFEDINLIEINIPQGAESEFEEEIRNIAIELSSKLNWEIDWRE